MASEKITAIVEEIKALTILEVADLVKVLEAEFGVSAAPVAVAAVGGAAAPGLQLGSSQCLLNLFLSNSSFSPVLCPQIYSSPQG